MKEYLIKNIDDFKKIHFDFKKGNIFFLKGDLGAGKTTLVRFILKKYFNINDIIKSPTYTYYQKYTNNNKKKYTYKNIYHMDLFRLGDYNEFINIGGEEILDNKENLIFIEWPNILEEYYKADYNLDIKIINNNNNTNLNEIRKISI